jgi:hypothetical protein
MRPLLTVDKITLFSFSLILIVIGVFPSVIAPIVQSGVTPVVERLHDAQTAATFLDTVQTAATNLFTWLGGA